MLYLHDAVSLLNNLSQHLLVIYLDKFRLRSSYFYRSSSNLLKSKNPTHYRYVGVLLRYVHVNVPSNSLCRL